MLARLLILLGLLPVLSPVLAAAEARHDCGSDRQNTTSYNYCIDTPANPSGEILWYFHPVLSNEQYWHDSEENVKIRGFWETRGVAEPAVITISMGQFWLMTPENGVYADFVKLIMPALEAKAGGVHGRRLLLGFSMGGLNSSQLLLRDAHLFDRVAMLSPALITVGPFSPQSEVDAYMDRNNLDFQGRFKVNAFLRLLRQNFSTEQSWKAFDPLELLQSGLAPASIVYVSDGDEDNYGFHEGALAFVSAASSRGNSVQWDSLHGGHRSFNAEAVAKFLVP